MNNSSFCRVFSPFCIPPISNGVTSLRAERAKPSFKVLRNPLEYTEMCQLFRGEDYPTVYGTNTIPNFLVGHVVAYWPTAKTPESFRNHLAPGFKELNQKKHVERLALEQVIKCALTDTSYSGTNLIIWAGFQVRYIIVWPLVLMKGFSLIQASVVPLTHKHIQIKEDSKSVKAVG